MIRAAIRLQSFAFSGCCALLFPIFLGALQGFLTWLSVAPYAFAKPPLVWVATLCLWILVLLFARAVTLSAARRVLTDAGCDADEIALDCLEPRGDQRNAFSIYLPWPDTPPRGVDAIEKLSRAAHQSESRIHAWYLPVQGLIWALPAVGFLFTAWALRRAALIGLLKGGEPGNASRAALVAQLHPILGDALLVICIALGAAAVFHVVASVLTKAETEFVLDLRSALNSARRKRQRQ